MMPSWNVLWLVWTSVWEDRDTRLEWVGQTGRKSGIVQREKREIGSLLTKEEVVQSRSLACANPPI